MLGGWALLWHPTHPSLGLGLVVWGSGFAFSSYCHLKTPGDLALQQVCGCSPAQPTKKRREVVHARRTEVIASRSELLSLHCPRHPLLRALSPACAYPQVITRQDCSAYAAEPLRTAGLLEAAHQYSLQDMCGSARTPTPLNSLLRRDSLRT